MSVIEFKKGSETTTPEQEPLVTRYFTELGQDPLDQVTWVKRRSVISEPDGTIVFEMDDVEVPEQWSQLATDILASKYLRKAGVPETGHETSARQAIVRITYAITEWGMNHNYFKGKEEADIFQDELAYMLVNQIGAFNSPVWFNVGLYESYGITGKKYDDYERYGDRGEPDHGWCWDFEKGAPMPVVGAYERPRSAACFILRMEDSLESIFDTVRTEAMIFKYGSGSGLNASNLRSRFENLTGGGSSSGMISFLKVLDTGAGAIKSGGTTRRAACMRCVDVDHPEIMEFIDWKVKEELKARDLVATGRWGTDFNGEAYHTVSGQNANNTVRVTDHFMKAVEQDAEWRTTYRTTGETHETLKARDIWQAIAKATWAGGDPGLHFADVINDWHTCANTDRINASNPCSEFMFLDNTACNLASLNLMKFLEDDGNFDVEGYRHAIRIFSLAQDILVDYSSYPTKAITQNSHDYRPLGLGYANLGTLLMSKGLSYDSDGGRALASVLTAILCGEAYATSAQLASRLSPFFGFEQNREPMLRTISKHRNEAEALDITNDLSTNHVFLFQAARFVWERAEELGKVHGFRNAQMTVLAPTGTIGLLMDCSTTGVEPEYSLVKFKKLAGGGTVEIRNQNVERALGSLNYDANKIVAITQHLEECGELESLSGLIRPEDMCVFDTASANKPGGRCIPPIAHIRMLAAVQPFISGSISKTVNCPESTTVEEIEKLYMVAWKQGLKCVAIYRDKSKGSQPLNAGSVSDNGNGVGFDKVVDEAWGRIMVDSSSKSEFKPEQSMAGGWGVKRPLPATRKGTTVEARVGGHQLFLRTGEYEDGSLGEIFIDMHKEGAAVRAMMNEFAIAVSIALQHGVPLKKYVDKFTFTRFEPSGMTDHPEVRHATSILDFIFRILASQYLGDSSLSHVPKEVTNEGNGMIDEVSDAPYCNTCGHLTVRNGTCYRCLSCGESMGCS